MAQATLYDPITGKPKVVDIGSQQAKDLQSKGYGLNAVEPLSTDPYSMDFLSGLSDRMDSGQASKAYIQAQKDYQNQYLNQNAFADALKNSLTAADKESAALKKLTGLLSGSK